MPQLPPPPGATHYMREGTLMTTAQYVMADIRTHLQTHYEPSWDVKRWEVPKAMDWEAIKNHYAQSLGPDWKVDERYAEDADPRYRAKVWSDGEHAVALALIVEAGLEGEQVLTVFVSKPPR